VAEFLHQLLIDVPGIQLGLDKEANPLLQTGEVGDRDAGLLSEIRQGVSLLLAELPNGWANPLPLFDQGWFCCLCVPSDPSP
jgi:hypothetical protein